MKLGDEHGDALAEVMADQNAWTSFEHLAEEMETGKLRIMIERMETAAT